ncbi:hypothetical protein NEMBOFW57_004132 [Staphylotrichum longicolle]|uniref:Uncharacterized protein n=1 Tax=Staphylotrichum longicolle TaxID=669026 RepID=A0AAD4F730_9PEZI|nr:hypothetical protein NEMBOFW57_004132 [Staphylotrichum longicolle]
MSFPGGGHNPAFGRDTGPPPPFASLAGAPAPPPDYGPPPPGTSMSMPIPPPYYAMPAPVHVLLSPGLPPSALRRGATPAPTYGHAIAADPTGQLYQYISGFNGSGRFPQPAPPVDPDFPAANLINSTGGAGAEPGFNYFFPTEHAKVIVLKCALKPWTLVPGTYGDIPFKASLIPSNVTMAELLVGFGATNPNKEMDQLWEVYPQGGGMWGWKEHCVGNDEVMMARTVRDMGWLEKRDGKVQTVYLWISKNG